MSTTFIPSKVGPKVMLRHCRNCGDRAKLSKGFCRICAPDDFTHRRPSGFIEIPPPITTYRRCNMCDERKDAADFVGEMCGPCHRRK